MPSTENITLQRIQREISEVIEREKQLKNDHDPTPNNNNENEIENRTESTTPEGRTENNLQEDRTEIKLQEEKKTENKPFLIRSKSAYPVLNGNQSSTNGIRRFTPNASTKGVMHKFIKSRGKLNIVSSLKTNPAPVHNWTIPDFIEPPKVPVSEPGKFVRKGFVPIEERMRKEFQDYHSREMELRSERKKSQPDFNALVDIETPLPQSNLRMTRSMAQLYDVDDFMDEYNSAPSSLKPARSLAELCDASEDELETPGSHSLIKQWENLIQKNQQART